MGFFSFFGGPGINDKLEEMRGVDGAVLLDVRTVEEYRQGHIPGAINVPVENIKAIREKVVNEDTPIYTYCLSGARSRSAAEALKSMGYTNVVNIGGINRYKGEIEA